MTTEPKDQRVEILVAGLGTQRYDGCGHSFVTSTGWVGVTTGPCPNCERAQPPAASEGEREVCWLVERSQPENHDPPVWLMYESDRYGGPRWTADPHSAWKLPSREHADIEIRDRFTRPIGVPTAHASEHVFVPMYRNEDPWEITEEDVTEFLWAADVRMSQLRKLRDRLRARVEGKP